MYGNTGGIHLWKHLALPDCCIAHDQVYVCYYDAHDHLREGDSEKLLEGDLEAFRFSLACHDDVGAGADEGPVAAEARTKD